MMCRAELLLLVAVVFHGKIHSQIQEAGEYVPQHCKIIQEAYHLCELKWAERVV